MAYLKLKNGVKKIYKNDDSDKIIYVNAPSDGLFFIA